MATTIQIQKLRRKLQDFDDETGTQLASSAQAFKDAELNDLIDDAVPEVSDGARDYSNATAEDIALAMIIARIDGILMIAEDESRRKKWEFNNKVIDDTRTAQNLTAIARELRARYQAHQDRKLKRDVENISVDQAGSVLRLNDTVPLSGTRDFDNRDVNRNVPRR